MTGNITAPGTITSIRTDGTINYTLNCTTGILSSLSSTSNTNQAVQSVGNFGGTGDILIIYPGTGTS
jgi:hypothetical protein